MLNKLLRNKALQLAPALRAYAGQSLSRRFAFAALIVMQNVNLKPAAELNVMKKLNVAIKEIIMEQSERNIFLRCIYSLLWLIPVMLVINIAVGAVVGGFAGSQTVTFQEGHAAGQQASMAFFKTYGRFVYVAELIVWLALCILGKLPGTSKFKKVKS